LLILRLFSLMLLRPPISTLFPYTTLFRSISRYAGTQGAIASHQESTGSDFDCWLLAPLCGVYRAGGDRNRSSHQYLVRWVAPNPDRKSTRLKLQSLTNLVCRLLLEKKKTK